MKRSLFALFFISFNVSFSLCLSQQAWADNKPELMLASVYSSQSHQTDLNHYWVSEKYDGVRAYWNGEQFISRQGSIYPAPEWYSKDLPNYPLDGELWLGRGQFDPLSGIVRTQIPNDENWRSVRFMVFDMPEHSGRFNQRLKALNTLQISQDLPAWVEIVKQWKVKNEVLLLQQLSDLVAQGAEGLMLHDGRSFYSAKRNDDLIKLKPTMDSEGVVMSYVDGKGKFQGKMGAMWVKGTVLDEQGGSSIKTFKIGSGFSDFERANPPAIGSEITFKYSGLTSNGLPRFVRFWRLKNKQ